MRVLQWLGLAFALVSLAACGDRPSALRARMTYDFETPAGPRSGTTVIELRRAPATPYLPGGERGVYKQVGDAAAVELPDFPVFMDRNFNRILTVAARKGMTTPAVDLSDINPAMDKYTATFFRRMTAARVRAVVPVAALDPDDREDIRLCWFATPADAGSLKCEALPAFEAAHPGVKLVRIVAAVTDEPIPRGLDAKLPWLRAHQASVAHTIRENELGALRENY